MIDMPVARDMLIVFVGSGTEPSTGRAVGKTATPCIQNLETVF
jgi:hypothetical protein